MNYIEISKNLKEFSLGSEASSRFFKTGIGSYSEHDIFIGLPVPILRKFSKSYLTLSLDILKEFLYSKINEERLFCLIILTKQYDKADNDKKEKIYNFYLENLEQINNWNLVDSSAHLIIGKHLFNKDKKLLIKLANSDSIWKRRISIISTWYFIKNNQFDCTINLSKILIYDNHNLIHKSTGWMLREIGKRNIKVLQDFLKENASIMPRTMLRYSIEKFSKEEQKNYLNNSINFNSLYANL